MKFFQFTYVIICFSQGCYDAAVNFFEDKLLIIGATALGIALFQVRPGPRILVNKQLDELLIHRSTDVSLDFKKYT